MFTHLWNMTLWWTLKGLRMIRTVKMSNEEYTEAINFISTQVGYKTVIEHSHHLWSFFMFGYLKGKGFDITKTIEVAVDPNMNYRFYQSVEG